jgi:hypothetical protein
VRGVQIDDESGQYIWNLRVGIAMKNTGAAIHLHRIVSQHDHDHLRRDLVELVNPKEIKQKLPRTQPQGVILIGIPAFIRWCF